MLIKFNPFNILKKKKSDEEVLFSAVNMMIATHDNLHSFHVKLLSKRLDTINIDVNGFQISDRNKKIARLYSVIVELTDCLYSLIDDHAKCTKYLKSIFGTLKQPVAATAANERKTVRLAISKYVDTHSHYLRYYERFIAFFSQTNSYTKLTFRNEDAPKKVTQYVNEFRVKQQKMLSLYKEALNLFKELDV